MRLTIRRCGHEPFYRALTAAEAWALSAAARGGNFAALCNGLRRLVGAQFLRNWLSEGLVCGIDTRPRAAQ